MRASTLGINKSGFLPTSGLFFNLAEARLRNAPETKLASLPPPPILRVGPSPLAMTDIDWSKAAWDTIPAYRLSKETVDSFLQGLFGYYNFYTQVLLPLSTFSIQSI
jgi:hypothetical protein